jgi:lysophospholipase L1-like esterase
MTLRKLVILAAMAVLSSRASAQPSFYLRDGDSVVFYGDSITEQRFYTRDVQDYVATRYPLLKIQFHNAGIAGDSVHGGYTGDSATRVSRDVKPWNPDVITVMLGMNDGGYAPPDKNILAAYQAGYTKLLHMLHDAAPSARMTLLENTPYDEITHGTEFKGYMATTEQNANAAIALAAQEHLAVVDTNTPVVQFLRRAKAANPSFASLLVPDRIHPSEPLHWVMAEALMKQWNLDPVVSSVTIDHHANRVTESRRTAVANLAENNGRIEWDQMDEALPLPFNFDSELMNFVLANTDLFSLDQEMLKVHGLPAKRYALRIDGMAIGNFTARQLDQGINLATMKTPMWQKARQYDGKLGERSVLESADVTLNYATQVAGRADGSRILREGQAEIEQKLKDIAGPVKHHYVLASAGAANSGEISK